MEEFRDSAPHCKYFVTRKKRFCKMSVKSGQEYCGEHQKISETNVGDSSPDCESIRIVCPLDRKHTCYAHNLRRHLKICNAREKPTENFISKGINYGYESDTLGDNTYNLLSTFTVPKIKNTIDKVNEIYEKYITNRITEKILGHAILEKEMLKPEYGDKTKKHLKQASSILGLLIEYQLIKLKTCYIEFGAGRGQLSYWLAQVIKDDTNSAILLVEKASPKHKKDNKLLKDSHKIKRVRADISDLVLDKLDSVSLCENIVGVTKHLCGEATDLALRCLTNTSCKEKVSGGVFTFCCHHRCRWIPYTGKEFFKKHNLSKTDFEIMCNMASWAVCGRGVSRERRNQEPNVDQFVHKERDLAIGLDHKQKEEVGRRSKNVLNWGRAHFLEQLNFKCNLHYYVDVTTSLENVCIVMYK